MNNVMYNWWDLETLGFQPVNLGPKISPDIAVNPHHY
jgi:hypothetical protein